MSPTRLTCIRACDLMRCCAVLLALAVYGFFSDISTIYQTQQSNKTSWDYDTPVKSKYRYPRFFIKFDNSKDNLTNIHLSNEKHGLANNDLDSIQVSIPKHLKTWLSKLVLHRKKDKRKFLKKSNSPTEYRNIKVSSNSDHAINSSLQVHAPHRHRKHHAWISNLALYRKKKRSSSPWKYDLRRKTRNLILSAKVKHAPSNQPSVDTPYNVSDSPAPAAHGMMYYDQVSQIAEWRKLKYKKW